LTRSPLLAGWVIVLHLLVSFVESHIIAPALYGRVMHLHPAVVLLALFVGAKVAGVPGVLFAVPVTVVVVAILEEAHVLRVPPRAPLEAPSPEEKV
jgi:putative heme transporter